VPIFECYVTKEEALDLLALAVERHALRIACVGVDAVEEFSTMDERARERVYGDARTYLLGPFSLRPSSFSLERRRPGARAPPPPRGLS
jgi:hypothetical protein